MWPGLDEPGPGPMFDINKDTINVILDTYQMS